MGFAYDAERLMPMITANDLFLKNELENYLVNFERLLEKWGHMFSTTPIVFIQNPLFFDYLFTQGLTPIPCIQCGDDKGAIYIKGFRSPYLSVRDFDPQDERKEFLDYVLTNQNKFPFINIGNSMIEVHHHDHTPNFQIIYEIVEKFPTIEPKKIMVAPWHGDVLDEMQKFAGNLKNAPMRKALLDTGIRHVCMYFGFEFLDITPRPLLEWMRPFHIRCGMGYENGAVNHNLRKMMDLKMQQALFILPTNKPRHKADVTMYKMTTDIRTSTFM